ncbi:MAG TPA: KGK family protein [Cyanobacteria bacterium UBA11149]|nr:KGK family protein [Cyanobacteria bacterium UBA11367]HBE61111.1 KGK family protein [Cyanobacteria bacterium UBA11366]HBK64379.1 KGK family protein [Cyanobacteria bacterium UBA11166]HBR72713.1 KGK family protein [Cyanobacteria bacterium UBA11159]HBS70717.1 KGK family protein [Cyanobacteria bacterium UBA11153]HBW90666.1 KGK family protein [Cyanobacteria bacterium UBA11149]HCA96132.1 KGK family protein [Cyanobacteria bacterium UBA9226]
MKLQQNEIVSLDEHSIPILLPHPTFKVSELLKAIITKIINTDNICTNAANSKRRHHQEIHEWWDEGIDCEVLTCDGKGWQKGKVRLALEFIPDEPEVEEISVSNQLFLPESPLDDLRQMMNDNS